MPPRQTPGKRLVRMLNEALPEGVEWTERERAILDLIEAQTDRISTLRGLLDAETDKPMVSTRRVTELAAEIRQLETSVSKLSATLDPEMQQVKSARHQYAANTRWRRNHG